MPPLSTQPFKHKLDPAELSPDFPGHCHPSKLTPQPTHSYLLYKYGDIWAFNHWQCAKYDEGLLNGSELALDWHYHQLSGEFPNHRSELYATFSLAPIGDHTPTTELIWLGPDTSLTHNPHASFYLDTAADMNWWLCPFWGDMWGGSPPKHGYLYLTLTNG